MSQRRQMNKRKRLTIVSLFNVSGIRCCVIIHKQRQVIAGLNIFRTVQHTVPAHHVFDIDAVMTGNTVKRITLTNTIGDAVAVISQSGAIRTNGQSLTRSDISTAQVVILLQCRDANAKF